MNTIFAFFCVFALACAAMAQQSPFTMNWSTYKSGEFSKIKSYQTFTIGNQSDFGAYWAASTGNPAETAPKDIDWMKNEVLAIHLGERQRRGYSVYVDSIDMITAADYNVHAVEQVPGDHRDKSGVTTSPYIILLLPRRYAQYNVSVTQESSPLDTGRPGRGGGDRDHHHDPGQRDGYRLVERGYLSDGPQLLTMEAIGSQREWDRYWDRVQNGARLTIIGRSGERSIDWDNDQVLVLQAGPSAIEEPVGITRVRRTRDGYTVYVVKHASDQEYGSGQTVFPYVVIEVPGHGGKFNVNVTVD